MNLRKIAIDKTYLITGAAGFIGAHVAKYLLKLGCSVVGYDNLNDYYDVSLKLERLKRLNEYQQFSFYKSDLADNAALERVFSNHKIDVVIHLAAQAGVRYSLENPRAYINSNIVGTFNVLELCKNYKVQHLLFASSSSVYGGNDKVPYSVDDKTDCPVSLYAATKKCDELIAYTYSHLHKLPITGMRFFTVYGPYGRPDMAYFSFTNHIFADKAIKIYNRGDMYRDFTYIDDVVESIIRLIDNSRALKKANNSFHVYNIGNHKPEKLMDFIQTLEKCLSKEAIKEYYDMQPGDVYKTYAEVSDLIEDVDFRPNTSLEEGLSRFAKWYQEYYTDKNCNCL